MSRKHPDILVLGDCRVAKVLTMILRAVRVERREDDRGWNWPSLGRTKLEKLRLILIACPQLGESRLIRFHDEAWDCPLSTRLSSLMVLCRASGLAKLLERDAFGRREEHRQSLGSWAEGAGCLGIVEAESGLATIVKSLSELTTWQVDTWRRHRREANCVLPLVQAVKNRDFDALTAQLPMAMTLDWDAVCFGHPHWNGDGHAWANDVWGWLHTVSLGVTPDWMKADRIFLPFEFPTN